MTEQIRLFDSPPVRRYPTPQSVICNDCSRLVWDELYMVHDDVWPLLPWEGLLCIGCIEERIGRRLTPADFTDAPANDPTAPRFQGSRRFLDRLGWSERSPRRA